MGFLDKAKAAAMDLQAKADTALGNSGLMGGSPMGAPGGSGGQGDRLLRDLGVLTYLNAVGTPGSADDYNRIMALLQQLAQQGQLNLSLTPAMGAPGGPPPPPGAVKASYAAGQASAAPPPPGSAAPPPPPGGGFAPPPPPPPPGGGFPAPVAPDAAPGTPSAGAPVAADAPAQSTVVDVPEEVVEVAEGGGATPPPPPPSWA